MRKPYPLLLLLVPVLACSQLPTSTTATTYYPGRGNAWKTRAPAEVGMNAARLEEAVEFAKTQETTQIASDFSNQAEIFGTPLGPLPPGRAATNGLVLRHGYIVAEWGNTQRPDPTYSVAKSMLSTVLGITLDKGMIKDIHDPVAQYVPDGGYASAHNQPITWEQHARQTSEWEGELWGKNADFIGHEAFGKGERKPRTLQAPGTYWEYNDVRINRFSLSLLTLWQKPLPQVVKEQIMDPIGASDTWQYLPYFNSMAVIHGRPLPSVSGGTRWGAGLWISARDEARFGYLMLRQGQWGTRQIVSRDWVRQATTRGPIGPDYGYLWWLNTEQKAWPHAPATSFAALGAGSNTIWIDPEHDIVLVWRWHNGNPDELIKRVLAAVEK
ncbi:beta-lactamase family protein [Hymenobacter aerilatus]|uniref:Beta-lactamase family protein n=1 Tax=Hymenobacter aerilatus TaxID=2932251 RepID=A0A8T9SY10_9BACT|nr:serine hydrolase [Hymenobacter aerilatus]UOR07132.1 beta-lactamase family protein [Hymenobacter aerilatus]